MSFINEVREVVSILRNQCSTLEKEDNSTLFNSPLKLHGEYTRAQIQEAINRSTFDKKSSGREGVERSEIQGQQLEAMFVDIIKDREEGSNTNYNDFAQSNILSHWESQNCKS